MTRAWTLLLLVSAAMLAPVRPAQARPAWHLEAHAVTDAPLQIGARATLEMPGRLQISSSLGVVPGMYVDLFNGVAVEVGAYNQATANLIGAALQAGMVWRTHIGWRPFSEWGLYVQVGYGIVALGGGLGNEADVKSAGGADGGSSSLEYRIGATLHMFDAEIGYRWSLFSDRVSLLAAIGFAGTVAADASVEPTFNAGILSGIVAAINRGAEAYLEDVLTSYVFTPVVSLAVGYRFF